MACQSARWFMSVAVVIVAGAICPVTQAGDEKSARRGRFEAIKADLDKQFGVFVAAAKAAKTDVELQAAQALRPSLQTFARRFLALAQEQPADEVSCDALLWIAANYARREKLNMDVALDLLEKHHLHSPKLKSVVPALVDADSPRAAALAETLAEKAGDREVRGMTALFLAYRVCERTDIRDPRNLAKAERWLERIKKDYADVRWETRTLGEMAEAQLFEVRHLIPGKAAPEIEGLGVDGKKMKLSDHRGKVVVLVFWGSWCGPCMAEVPHLRDLTTKHSRRPFTVVGVNSGDAKEQAAKVVAAEKMTWPILVDGEDGPIVRKWNVTSFPTIYILDAAGVIRFKNNSEEEFNDAVERLVWEAERKR